jgi:hypothetical protein
VEKNCRSHTTRPENALKQGFLFNKKRSLSQTISQKGKTQIHRKKPAEFSKT